MLAGVLLSTQVDGATIAQQNFINAVYVDLLGRPVDPGGLAAFSMLLDQGGTDFQVALDVLDSPEYRQDLVKSFFESYLHRPADPLGLTTFVGALTGGATDETVQADLLGSPEYFQNRGGGTNQGFLDALYPDVLDRPIDPMADVTFLNFLGGGGSRMDVATTLLTSREYDIDLVTGYYNRFLGRPLDMMGQNTFVTELQPPNDVTDEVVIAQILGSSEFFQDAQTMPEPAPVPEPASWTLAAFGAGVLLMRRRAWNTPAVHASGR